jgi:hypothetical protein
MSYPITLRKSEKATVTGYTQEQPDIANSVAALFMIDVTDITKGGSLQLIMQAKDAASGKWFNFCKLKLITAVGQYIYPEMDDSRFFQSIPGTFRFKYEIPDGAEITFSIGFNAVS